VSPNEYVAGSKRGSLFNAKSSWPKRLLEFHSAQLNSPLFYFFPSVNILFFRKPIFIVAIAGRPNGISLTADPKRGISTPFAGVEAVHADLTPSQDLWAFSNK
jgi:hypothetical protein